MGRVAPGFRARVVDENDEEVADGTAGELVLRSDEPFSFATGYYRNPEATVEAWRNLWHHTGDQVVRDADGWFVFKQRLNDRIRRRGENVSAWEVEQVLESHPTVALAAVIGVPSELGEEDVMAFVVPSDGMPVAPAELVEHCRPLLARFALPRFVEIVDSLPLTTTGKVEKYRLRTQLPDDDDMGQGARGGAGGVTGRGVAVVSALADVRTEAVPVVRDARDLQGVSRCPRAQRRLARPLSR